MLIIQARPYQYCWSGNAVFYQLFSDEALADPSVFFEIKVMFTTNIILAGVDAEDIITIPYIPLSGVAKINIQDILDSLLSFQMPSFNADEKIPFETTTQSGKFYILYRQITPASTDPSWETEESAFIRTVFKGGISFFKYQGQNFWNNYFNIKFPFLTWQLSKKLVGLSQRIYLPFLTLLNIASGNIKMNVRVVFTDASEETLEQVLDITPARVWYLPVGAFQWGLATLQPAKKIWFWEITVVNVTDPANPVNMSEIYRYYADNRNDYNNVTLHFRNSLGGIDSIQVRGVIQTNLDYTTVEKDGIFDADYYAGSVIEAPGGVVDNQEIVSYKGDIGYMGKDVQDRLRDLLVKREVYLEKNQKWIAVIVDQKSFTLKGSTDNKWSLPISWKPAIGGDRYYTPDLVNLGNDPPQSNTCPLGVKNWTITPEVDGGLFYLDNAFEIDGDQIPIEVQYQVVGFGDWATIPTSDNYAGTNTFRFSYIRGNIYTTMIRVRCANGEYGSVSSQTIKTDDPALPPPPVSNSILQNNSSILVDLDLIINPSNTAFTVGPRGTTSFNVANMNDVSVTVRFTMAYIPSTARLESNGVFYSGTIINAGGQGIITFTHVNIIGGITITWG